MPGPAPVCELMTVKVRTVSGPHTPSGAVPQFDWNSSSARAVLGPRMPSTRPQSKPSRPSRDCSSATSSPRRFGEVRNSSRSPSFQLASTSAVQVCLVAATVAAQPAAGLEGTHGGFGGRTKSRRLGAGGGWEPGGTEAALQIADGLAALTGCQREVGRNSLSS